MSVFEEPQCLIYTDSSSKKLCLEKRVIKQLKSVSKQLHVIAIAGLYRTGKSYLLTRIAVRYKGFAIGSSLESKTKGIWAWCMDHPVHTDQALLLLDTEGIGDIEKEDIRIQEVSGQRHCLMADMWSLSHCKQWVGPSPSSAPLQGDCNNDNQILTLATLLSSTLIYNTFGMFDDNALKNMNFITEMTKRIKISEEKQSMSGDTDFQVSFPEFILTLRDFSLDLELHGREVSPDQYLEHCLKAKKGKSEDVKSYNETRLCISENFKKRKCFVIGTPAANATKLKKLDNLTDSDLDEQFVENTKQFLDYIHNKTVPMALTDGTPVTGRMFCTLVRSYIDAIRQGAVPCIQSALRSMAIIENESAVKEAMSIYCKEMNTRIILPTQTEQELRNVHLKSEHVAFEHFRKRRVLDDEKTYELKLDKLVREEYENLVSMNENKSRKKCKDTLKRLHATISSKLNDSLYAVSGGYELYRRDREELKQTYYNTEGLGLMKSQAYVEYEDQTKNESVAVLKSDQIITKTEKDLQSAIESQKKLEEMYSTTKKLVETTQMDKKQQENTNKQLEEIKLDIKQKEKKIKDLKATIKEQKNIPWWKWLKIVPVVGNVMAAVELANR